jgi:RNA-directed DNA polymerase
MCSENKRGWFELRRQSVAKRKRAKLQEIKEELHRRMHHDVSAVGKWLRSVVQGWYNYHAVPGNQDRLNSFRDRVTRYWLHVLRRRSQRGRKRWTWQRFRRRLVSRWIPSVRTKYPYPTQRLIVTT